jgi:hypothetical protein
VAQTLYTVTTPPATAVPLVAATAKSVISIQGGTDFGIDLKKYRLEFDGVTSTAVPVLVEVCTATFAGLGTSTAITALAAAGRQNAATGFVSGGNYTVEPTALTTLTSELVPAYMGSLWFDFMNWGDTPDSALNQGFVIRCTAPAAVNCRATLWFGRC